MLEQNIVQGPRGLTGPLPTLYLGPVAKREALNFGRTFVAAKWNFKRRMFALQTTLHRAAHLMSCPMPSGISNGAWLLCKPRCALDLMTTLGGVTHVDRA